MRRRPSRAPVSSPGRAVRAFDGLRFRRQLGHRRAEGPEVVDHGLVDQHVAIGQEQDAFLAPGERALAVAAQVGGVALAIDAKTDEVARWYRRFGAQPLLDDPLKLILPLAVVADALASSGTRP